MASQGGAIGRRLSHGSEALMNGVSALTKETPEALRPFATCGYNEKTATWNAEEGPHQTWRCCHADLGHLPSITVREKIYVVYIPSSLYNFVTAALMDEDTCSRP